jgi:SAM-dependent methyltransferase
VAYSLRKGRAHPTLGLNLQAEGDWWDAGKPIFNRVLDLHPITEAAKVCEYGCGSLRVGAHFIERQSRDCFFGLDVTEDFIAYGRELIGPTLLEDKRPRLGTISKKIDEAVAFDVDMLYSTHVAIHVHPDEKQTYIDNIKRIAHKPGSTIIFDALIVRQHVRFRNSGWGWPMDFYLKAMEPFQLVHIAYSREREGVGQQFFLVFQR